jgi:hypothetical protein
VPPAAESDERPHDPRGEALWVAPVVAEQHVARGEKSLPLEWPDLQIEPV